MKYAKVIGGIFPVEDTDGDFVQIEGFWVHKNRVTIIDGLSYEEASTMPQPEDFKPVKPSQYKIGIDTFDRAFQNMTKEELLAAVKFTIDKYTWRKKGQDLDDFKKIIDYANFGIKVLNEK